MTSEIRTDDMFAAVIVRDTVLSSHEDAQLSGDETVKTVLRLLEGECGDGMVQDVLADYMGVDNALARLHGVEPGFDSRVVGMKSLNAQGVKNALLGQFRAYLGQPPIERALTLQYYRELRECEQSRQQ